MLHISAINCDNKYPIISDGYRAQVAGEKNKIICITYVDMWIYFGFWLFNILKTYVKDNGMFKRQL